MAIRMRRKMRASKIGKDLVVSIVEDCISCLSSLFSGTFWNDSDASGLEESSTG